MLDECLDIAADPVIDTDHPARNGGDAAGERHSTTDLVNLVINIVLGTEIRVYLRSC
jgi:hypothetical protein